MGGMASHEQPKGLARPAASQPAMKKEPESVRSGTSQQYSSLDVGRLRTIQRGESLTAQQQQSRRPRKIVNLPTPHIASLLAFFPSSFQHFFGIFTILLFLWIVVVGWVPLPLPLLLLSWLFLFFLCCALLCFKM